MINASVNILIPLGCSTKLITLVLAMLQQNGDTCKYYIFHKATSLYHYKLQKPKPLLHVYEVGCDRC